MSKVYLGLIKNLWSWAQYQLSISHNDNLLQEALNYKEYRQQSFGVGRALLSLAWHEHKIKSSFINCQNDNNIFETLPSFERGNLGRPYVPFQFHCDFNVSHSHDVIALILDQYKTYDIDKVKFNDTQDKILSTKEYNQDKVGLGLSIDRGKNSSAKSDMPYVGLGLDIELVQLKRAKGELIKRVLNSQELSLFEYLKHKFSLSLAMAYFTQQWTIKEAIVKALGLSILSLDKLHFDLEQGIIFNPWHVQGEVYTFALNYIQDLSLNSQVNINEQYEDSKHEYKAQNKFNKINALPLPLPLNGALFPYQSRAQFKAIAKHDDNDNNNDASSQCPQLFLSVFIPNKVHSLYRFKLDAILDSKFKDDKKHEASLLRQYFTALYYEDHYAHLKLDYLKSTLAYLEAVQNKVLSHLEFYYLHEHKDKCQTLTQDQDRYKPKVKSHKLALTLWAHYKVQA